MNQASKIALFAMAAGLAACSESSMAPVADASESTAYVNGGGATMDLSPTNVVRFSITIDPSRNTYYYLGAGNSLTFPAGTPRVRPDGLYEVLVELADPDEVVERELNSNTYALQIPVGAQTIDIEIAQLVIGTNLLQLGVGIGQRLPVP